MENRRRVPRQPAGWVGSCHLDGEAASGWRDCRVIDISTLGLGITLHHPRPSELVGRRLVVEVPAFGDSVNVRLAGDVKNILPARGLGRAVRVGIEFTRLSNVEEAVVSSLSTMSARSRDEHPIGARQ